MPLKAQSLLEERNHQSQNTGVSTPRDHRDLMQMPKNLTLLCREKRPVEEAVEEVNCFEDQRFQTHRHRHRRYAHFHWKLEG